MRRAATLVRRRVSTGAGPAQAQCALGGGSLVVATRAVPSALTATAHQWWSVRHASGTAAAAAPQSAWATHRRHHATATATAAAAAAEPAAQSDDASLAPCERGPQQQAANELDDRLAAAARAGGPAAVLELIEAEGEGFTTELNVVTALEQIASSSKSSSNTMSAQEIVRAPGFQILVGERERRRGLQQCARTVPAGLPCAHAAADQPPIASPCPADMVLAGMMRFPPPLLAQAVHCCGQLGARCACRVLAVGRQLERHPLGLQLCSLCPSQHPLPAAPRCRSEEMLLDEIGRHIMKHVDELAPADVAALVGGYAALDHAPSPVLFDALAARAEALRGEFTAEQAQAIAQGYAALEYPPPQLR